MSRWQRDRLAQRAAAASEVTATLRVRVGRMYVIKAKGVETGRKGRRFIVTGVRVAALSVRPGARAAALVEGWMENRGVRGGCLLQSVTETVLDLSTESEPDFQPPEAR